VLIVSRVIQEGDRASQAGEEGQTAASIVQPGCTGHTGNAEMPKEFKQEVEKELTGRETEPWEIIYFKLYKSQTPVIELADETESLNLGSDRSRGWK